MQKNTNFFQFFGLTNAENHGFLILFLIYIYGFTEK